MHDEALLKLYKRWGVEPPAHFPHGSEEEIRQNLKPVKASSWYMEGNILVAETDQGILKQAIPTDYICKGIDTNGLPILEKLL